jgi:2-oxo-3-hexenedioate decarboxylase
MTRFEAVNPNKLADIIVDAQLGGYEIGKITDMLPLSIEQSYAVQVLVVARLLERGARVIGMKTGLTSLSKQRAMGMYESLYGYLLDSGLVQEGKPVSLSGLIHPRAEPELAFVMGKPLLGPGVTTEQALAATAEIKLAIELIDSRYRNFDFTLADVVADNCSAGKFLLSRKSFSPSAFDLTLMSVNFEKNGELLHVGTGAEVLGHPANVVAWLANKLYEMEGRGLSAGEIVLAGAFTPAVEIKPGDVVTATFAGADKLVLQCMK